MPNAHSVKRKLDTKVIKRLGLNTVMLRSAPASGLDAYGEQIDNPLHYISTPIRIVIDKDKRNTDPTDIGGLPDKKKEFLNFYVTGSFDIRPGDKIVYPANSVNQWLVDAVEPNMFNDVCVITEA